MSTTISRTPADRHAENVPTALPRAHTTVENQTKRGFHAYGGPHSSVFFLLFIWMALVVCGLLSSRQQPGSERKIKNGRLLVLLLY